MITLSICGQNTDSIDNTANYVTLSSGTLTDSVLLSYSLRYR